METEPRIKSQKKESIQEQTPFELLWAGLHKEGDPKIKIHFSFGPHLNSLDALRLKKDFEECDVFMPEGAGWREETQDFLRKITDGRESPESFKKTFPKLGADKFMMTQVEMFYKSRKNLIMIDTPHGHPVLKKYDDAEELRKKAYLNKNLDEKIKIYKEFHYKFAEAVVEREAYILAQVPKKLRNLLDGNLKLRGKPEVKIFIALGANHTPIFINMKKAGVSEVTRSFQSLPYIYDGSDQTLRRFMFGQDIELLSRDEQIRAIFQAELGENFYQRLTRQKGEVATDYIKQQVMEAVNYFSISDIEKFYKKIESGSGFAQAYKETVAEKSK